MSKAARIQCLVFSSFIVGAIVFIIIAFGSEMLDTKASDTFPAYLKNGDVVDVIVLTKSPYSERKWNKVRVRIIAILATTYTLYPLPKAITDMLVTNDVDILTISITPKVYKTNE